MNYLSEGTNEGKETQTKDIPIEEKNEKPPNDKKSKNSSKSNLEQFELDFKPSLRLEIDYGELISKAKDKKINFPKEDIERAERETREKNTSELIKENAQVEIENQTPHKSIEEVREYIRQEKERIEICKGW